MYGKKIYTCIQITLTCVLFNLLFSIRGAFCILIDICLNEILQFISILLEIQFYLNNNSNGYFLKISLVDIFFLKKIRSIMQ